MLTRSTPLRRTPLRRRSRMPAKRATPRRSERVIDRAFLAFVHTQPCCARELLGHACEGRIEADHAGGIDHAVAAGQSVVFRSLPGWRLRKEIAALPTIARPFTDEERAACLDAVIEDALPPRAAALMREHFIRCAPKHGVKPGHTRDDRGTKDHLAGAIRHIAAVVLDQGAVDAESGALHLTAATNRLALALETHVIEMERRRG